MMMEGSGSGSIPLTSGSGSGRPNNMRIRIRIRNTAFYTPKLSMLNMDLGSRGKKGTRSRIWICNTAVVGPPMCSQK
jgi:hypothetical protein